MPVVSNDVPRDAPNGLAVARKVVEAAVRKGELSREDFGAAFSTAAAAVGLHSDQAAEIFCLPETLMQEWIAGTAAPSPKTRSKYLQRLMKSLEAELAL